MRLERPRPLPPDLPDLLVAARAEALGMVETLLAGGFVPFEAPRSLPYGTRQAACSGSAA